MTVTTVTDRARCFGAAPLASVVQGIVDNREHLAAGLIDIHEADRIRIAAAARVIFA